MSTYGAAATGSGMASHAAEPAGASDAVHIALAQVCILPGTNAGFWPVFYKIVPDI